MFKNILLSTLTVLIGATQVKAMQPKTITGSSLNNVNNVTYEYTVYQDDLSFIPVEGYEGFGVEDYCSDNVQYGNQTKGNLLYGDAIGYWEQTNNDFILYFYEGSQVFFHRVTPECI